MTTLPERLLIAAEILEGIGGQSAMAATVREAAAALQAAPEVVAFRCEWDADGSVAYYDETNLLPDFWDKRPDRIIPLASPTHPAAASEGDGLLRDLGLDPERFRSEGGSLIASKVRAAILHPDEYSGHYLNTSKQAAGEAVAPDYDMAAHWIDRYAAGIDEYVQLDLVCAALGVREPPEDWGPVGVAIAELDGISDYVITTPPRHPADEGMAEAYPVPRNRTEAAALAKIALAHLGVVDAHIDAAIARCETNAALAGSP